MGTAKSRRHCQKSAQQLVSFFRKSMKQFMIMEVRFLREGLGTVIAFVRPFPGMYALVSPQVGPVIKALVAERANKRPLSCVNTLVHLPVALARETLATKATNKWMTFSGDSGG